MGATQPCFEQKANKSSRINRMRFDSPDNDSFIKTTRNNYRISISIKKTYEKNQYLNFRKMHSSEYHLSKKEITKSEPIKENKINEFHTITKKKSSKSVSLIQRKLSNMRNYIKGEFKGNEKFCKVYSGLCALNGEIITIKVFDSIPKEKRKNIIKNKEEIYKLSNPHIIKINYLCEEENGDLCAVYESLNFNNVEQLINKFGALDEKMIQMYSRQLLEGLKYLHEQKIYHRYLTTKNILVDTDGTIKICDFLESSLIFGKEKEIYDSLVSSEVLEYYTPPFFIKYINKYYIEENNFNLNSNDLNLFEYWQAYDLWSLGCIIIEASSGKKPWAQYKYTNNEDLFNFLKETNLTPNIPKKLSQECQELIKILLNPALTNDIYIYDTLFNLNFFKNNYNGDSGLSNSINITRNQESKSNFYNNKILDSGTKLGQILENNKIVNLLNSRKNPSFTVTYTGNENSLTGSYFSNNLYSSIKSNVKNETCNNGNKLDINLTRIKTVKTITSDMPEVKECLDEQSPDLAGENKKDFTFEDMEN